MEFIHRSIHYATYAYYSSSFLREYFPKLVRPSFWLNFPLFYWGTWLFLEGFLEEQLTDEAAIEIFGSIMNFLLIIGIGSSVWLVPQNHLLLYKKIFSLSDLKDIIPESFNFTALSDKTTRFKYIMSQLLYLSVSIYTFFVGAFLCFFLVFFIFGFFAMAAVTTSNINFILMGFLLFLLVYVVLYAVCFGFPSFLPIVLLFHKSWKNHAFLAKSTSFGMKNLKYMILLFSLEALVKILSLAVFGVIISMIKQVSLDAWDFQNENIFQTLPSLVEGSIAEEKFYLFLVIIFWGSFNIFWDIFKACFISYLFTHQSKQTHIGSLGV